MIGDLKILVCGVGGQGVLTLSKILAVALHKHGLNVVVGETLGMSQRGGSVHSYVKASKSSPLSPVMVKNEANVLIGLELTEAARALSLLKEAAAEYGNYTVKDALVIVSTKMNVNKNFARKIISDLVSYGFIEVNKGYVIV